MMTLIPETTIMITSPPKAQLTMRATSLPLAIGKSNSYKNILKIFSSIRKYLKASLIQPVNHNVINDDFNIFTTCGWFWQKYHLRWIGWT